MAPFTTIGVGGPARFFAHVATENILEEAIGFAAKHELPTFALGGGSNVLVRDEGFPGLVLYMDIRGDSRETAFSDRVECEIPAGTPWDEFVLTACRQDLRGVECLAGIPGRTGGTPVQNVGAYGQEVAQTIDRVRAFDRRLRSFVALTNAECQFSYRSSCFNTHARGRYLVTGVTFALRQGSETELTYADLQKQFRGRHPSSMEVYHAVREIRSRKGMLLSSNDPDSRSAGSFFKNPVIPVEHFEQLAAKLAIDVASIPHWPIPEAQSRLDSTKLSAAWLVEEAGFPKGFVSGKAGISSRHSLALINRGGATFADIAGLRDRIRDSVSEQFGIVLDQEPVEIGPDALDHF